MPDTSWPAGRAALIFARAGDAVVATLVPALQEAGIASVLTTQVSQGLTLLHRRPAEGSTLTLVIILDGLPGLAPPAIAKAVRGLPGLAEIPLAVSSAVPLGLARCVALAPPVDAAMIRRLASLDPTAWPTSEVVPPVAVAPPAPVAAPGQIVLVVDDNEINRTVVSLQARGCGCPIETCSDGSIAVARIDAGGVALVLMDCQMPIMDGYAAAQEIRRREAGTGRHVPIIALTAHAFAENRERCQKAGMDDFLSKPTNKEELLSAIRHWLPLSAVARPVEPVPSAPPAPPVSAPIVFDPGPLQRIDQQAPGTARELLAMTHRELHLATTELPRQLAAGDLPALAKLAHRLKGALGSIGAKECAQACAGLEGAAKAGDPGACKQALPPVLAAIARLVEQLDGFVRTLPSAPH